MAPKGTDQHAMANALAELGLLGIFRVKMKRVWSPDTAANNSTSRCYKPASSIPSPTSASKGVLEICIRSLALWLSSFWTPHHN